MDDKSNIHNSFAVLQALLKQSYSEDPNELQKAAIELSRGNKFNNVYKIDLLSYLFNVYLV